MAGTLVPPWFKAYHVTQLDMSVVSIVWGISLGCTIFCAATATSQSLQTWQRSHRLTAYHCMIWIELVASTVIGVMSWLYMRDDIKPSFEFFFLLLVLWVVQTQVLLQIIVNRISLLLHHPRRVRAMKWAVAAYVGVINVSVFCIWVPAQLQRSRAYVDLNHVWDRVEKVLFMLLDAGLNVYFMWLVYSSLIANGLRKYRVLFWVNVGLDCVSIFLDVALILSMSFNNPFIYVQFHPLTYLLKLAIEMSLADLIARVARASNSGLGLGPDDDDDDSYGNTNLTYLSTGPRHRHHHAKSPVAGGPPVMVNEISSGGGDGGQDGDDLELGGGITKTVDMEVTRSDGKSVVTAGGDSEGEELAHSLDLSDRESQRWLTSQGPDVQKAYIP